MSSLQENKSGTLEDFMSNRNDVGLTRKRNKRKLTIFIALLLVCVNIAGCTHKGKCEECGQYEELNKYVSQYDGEVHWFCNDCYRIAKIIGY